MQLKSSDFLLELSMLEESLLEFEPEQTQILMSDIEDFCSSSIGKLCCISKILQFNETYDKFLKNRGDYHAIQPKRLVLKDKAAQDFLDSSDKFVLNSAHPTPELWLERPRFFVTIIDIKPVIFDPMSRLKFTTEHSLQNKRDFAKNDWKSASMIKGEAITIRDYFEFLSFDIKILLPFSGEQKLKRDSWQIEGQFAKINTSKLSFICCIANVLP